MDTAAEFVKIWMRLTKEWNALLEEELAPQLTAGQLEVLELLQAKEPMKPSDLLPYLETTPAAITTLLDRMERAGLVERKRDEHDRRIVWIHMTELGRSEVERGLRVRAEVANRSLERISAHNRQLLVYLIGKVAGSRDKTPSGPEPGQEAAGIAQGTEIAGSEPESPASGPEPAAKAAGIERRSEAEAPPEPAAKAGERQSANAGKGLERKAAGTAQETAPYGTGKGKEPARTKREMGA